MTECAKCGDCCTSIPWTDADIERVAKPFLIDGKLSPDPRDDWPSWVKEGSGGGEWGEDELEMALKGWRNARWVLGLIPTPDPTRFECSSFDRETRLCTIYDDRPHVCRDYPWYGPSPSDPRYDGQIGPEDFLPLRCSFWADVPRDQWPKGVDPLPVPVEIGATR